MKPAKPSLSFVIILGLANLLLIALPLRLWGVVLLALILPGWGWAGFFIPHSRRPSRWILSLGLSFAATILTTLLLHYLPGPIALWQLLLSLNLIAMLPMIINDFMGISPPKVATPANRIETLPTKSTPGSRPPRSIDTLSAPELIRANQEAAARILQTLRSVLGPLLLLAVLFLAAAYFRFANLGYSEFQGDEALAMTFAAEALEGHEDALFLRGKGPAELLLPLAMWRLNSTITELVARLPFAIAGLLAVITFHLLVIELFAFSTALYSTIFFAASGFMVGFSRIVQYQSLVIWMSILALWTLWQWQQSGLLRWAFLSGLFVGVGLLGHYDALLVLPALAWLIVASRFPALSLQSADQERTPTPLLPSLTAWFSAFLASTLPFYVPFLLDPQANRTGSYLSDRIGDTWLKNNLADFLQFNSFYSSFYYLLLMGLLLVGFIGWMIHGTRWGRGWGPVLVAIGLIGPTIVPAMLGNWTVLPYALILLGTFLVGGLNLPQRITMIWFAVPFLGYNFAVAQPLTHIYTIIPGWAILAGWVLSELPLGRRTIISLNLLLILLFGGYLWNGFIRTDVEFLQDYPAGNLALYQTPYPDRPATGFFGFAHKTGWKSVGVLLAEETLVGDYSSNEEEDVTSWYTRHAPRACDPGAEFYFIASDLIDPTPVPTNLLATEYQVIGRVALANGKSLTIQQRKPTELDLRTLNEGRRSRQFDAAAVPAAFARTPHWQIDAETNFGSLIRLRGYDLDTSRAYPDGRILLTLYWQALQPLDQSYKVFVQLDPEHKYGQADSLPVCGRYPTNLWRPGQIIADQHALHLDSTTPSGSYPLEIGLYLPKDGRRLDILDEAGNPAGVSLMVAEVEIGRLSKSSHEISPTLVD